MVPEKREAAGFRGFAEPPTSFLMLAEKAAGRTSCDVWIDRDPYTQGGLA